MSAKVLKAPFPAFGGKSKVADDVWARFGDPRNYVEPFAFTAAALLRRPIVGAIETINDLNHFVSNFWRAIQAAPDEVARHADWPVNEDDLHARHNWLLNSDQAKMALTRVREEPDYFDAKIAGWWCWGACCWIGAGWCDDQSKRWSTTASMHVHMLNGKGVNSQADEGDAEQLPHLTAGQGVNARPSEQLPHMDGAGRGVTGVDQTRPQLEGGGRGIHGNAKRPALCNGNTTAGPGVHAHIKRPNIATDGGEFGFGVHGRPQLGDAFARGRGVNANDSAGTCAQRRLWLKAWLGRLADRMRPVRVCCGHWMRVCDSPSTLTRLGMTGVFLDPPYRHNLACGKKNRSKAIYANDATQDINALCDEVQAWCLKWGDDPEIRIALCGLEGEYPLIEALGSWECFAWKSNGGYGNQSGKVNENAVRERIWFSPNCLKVEESQQSLFVGAL